MNQDAEEMGHIVQIRHLIHSGNTEVDSVGCIIVGNNTVRGKVLESLATFQNLYSILESAVDITIQIV